MGCYITSTGGYLPGAPVSNAQISDYLGTVLGEGRVRRRILKANGIQTRHYALDTRQRATHSVYELATEAAQACLRDANASSAIDYLAAGSTHAPLLAPGLASLVHDHLSRAQAVTTAVEINSNAGICSSGAQAIVNAARAVKAGDAQAALAIGAEQSSVALKSKAFRPTYDVRSILRDVKTSKWFMAVFLRFMLSDGAGAFLLEPEPRADGLSWRVDWTFARSYANEAPLCMQLERDPLVLTQNVTVLAEHMVPLSRKALTSALDRHDEALANYTMVLPHMSSYYFERSVRKILAELSPERAVPHWTNLRTAGNTGAASIFLMLDEYQRTQPVADGDRVLLFIPESGQFNYVMISLTAVMT
ncbi:MAG: hypothetical protein RhofKO_16860 [Rhodothermales bacterium]